MKHRESFEFTWPLLKMQELTSAYTGTALVKIGDQRCLWLMASREKASVNNTICLNSKEKLFLKNKRLSSMLQNFLGLKEAFWSSSYASVIGFFNLYASTTVYTSGAPTGSPKNANKSLAVNIDESFTWRQYINPRMYRRGDALLKFFVILKRGFTLCF